MNSMNDGGSGDTLDTLVIGGGQAGLAMGHYLKRQGRKFLILDANPRVGDAWRQRWDTMRLFTPAKYDGLPGMRFPGDRLSFPTKDELADYLEAYAAAFDLPVRTGTRVEKLRREDGRYVAASDGRRWLAGNVVVATGSTQEPRVPDFAPDLSPSIVQLHSSQYRNPGQLGSGSVLVVGLGNSGAEIALEVSRTHHTVIAGKPGGELPVRHGRAAARFVLPLVRFAGLHVLTLDTPIGRKAAPNMLAHADPLIRTKSKDLAAAGVEIVPRVTGVRDGRPVVAGRSLDDVSNVIWCTGYRESFGWIEAPVFDGGGRPRQHRGVAADVPGLFFLGEEFMYCAASATLPGSCRDARYLAGKIPAAPSSVVAGPPA
ncbi:flavin-containing monooxygenase [Arthrobacter sp. SPG23]|uniref:flavin-containing monooxygenase n=1 Tax=Arthrobacter sp. SPG23 TaxID=1610703 RepID=UPI0006962C35|nr:NAD(P)-binding domain-containing protein [Arthrobacter sp. SPG23]